MLVADVLLLASGALTLMALGAMLFFGAVVAPTLFQSLEASQAAIVLRRLFPRYYLVLAVVTGLATLLAVGALALGGAGAAGWARLWPVPTLLILATAGFVVARQWLTPRINASRDAGQAGDAAAAARFDSLHRWSVRLNGAQAAALAIAFVASVLP